MGTDDEDKASDAKEPLKKEADEETGLQSGEPETTEPTDDELVCFNGAKMCVFIPFILPVVITSGFMYSLFFLLRIALFPLEWCYHGAAETHPVSRLLVLLFGWIETGAKMPIDIVRWACTFSYTAVRK